MTDDNDDIFEQDAEEAADEFDSLTNRLYQRVVEFAEDEDVADQVLPLLLLRLAMSTRVMNYAISVAKPSASGLKLDLERFRREAEDLIRVM